MTTDQSTRNRNRIVLPVVLPVLVLLAVAAFIGLIAWMLLYTNRVLALTLAVIIATGIMVAISLANSIDSEDMTLARRGAIVLTAVLPLAAGVGIAVWSSAGGGLPEADLNINKEPALSAPEGALVGAKNDQSFCVFPEGAEELTEGNCEDVDEVTLPAQEGSFLFVFENLQAAIQHNFQIFELAGSADDPSAGEILFGVAEGSALITGPDSITYNVPAGTLEPGGQYYYNCIVHPVMDGVLTISEGEGGDAEA